jgi:aryl carrier-like protein
VRDRRRPGNLSVTAARAAVRPDGGRTVLEHQAGARRRTLQTAVHEAFRAYRPIDLHTDFFEAGFTSVQLADVVSRLIDQGLEMRIVDVYAHPTVQQLTDVLHSRYRQQSHVAPPWLDGGPDR